MLDFSDAVKKFDPDFITDPSLWKYCDEYFVMAALIHYYPEKYKNLVHSDKPDIIIPRTIGIEVTKCLEDSYNKSIGEWTNYRMGKNGKSYDRCKSIIAEQGGKMDEFGIVHRMSDENTQFAPIAKAIDNKLSKLKTYRLSFKECCLAIILEEPIDSVPKKAVDYFEKKQSSADEKFDILIIISNRELMIYDYKTKLLSKRGISREEKRALDNIGIMIVNGLIPSIKDCFVSNTEQIELDCLEDVKKSIFGESHIKIVKCNCDIEQIKDIIVGTKHSAAKNDFPDFVFNRGLIEHFIVSSSKDNKKGSSYKVHEREAEKQKMNVFQHEELEFLNSEKQRNSVMAVKVDDVFEESSYQDFTYSFKKHFDDHYQSLIRSNLYNENVIFLIDQQGGRLGIYENGQFSRFYLLSEDKNLLWYLATKYPKVNYVFFKASDALEIIDLSSIETLYGSAKDNQDIRGGRMINSSLKLFIDL